MIRALYTAASGMILGTLRQGLIAHDLANVTTPGYKRGILPPFPAPQLDLRRISTPAQATRAPQIGPLGTGVYAEVATVDFRQGPLQQTGRTLDVALEGPGFFQVQTPRGLRFTRDGRFYRDADGNLVTLRGYRVLDLNGQPIQLPQEGEIAIALDGTISVDGQVVGQIGIFQVPPDTLRREGDGLFVLTTEEAPTPTAQAQIRQGYLEGSNVDLAATLVEMMTVARTYEANQRLIQVQDQLLTRTMEIGRVG